MINVLHTVHPTEGYAVTIRYKRIDGVVSLLSICTHGKDILNELSHDEYLTLKSQVPTLRQVGA